MNVKDKIIFGLLIVLLAAGGYFQWMADDMKSRMDELNKNDQEHLDVIDREFREDLRNLNLRFEGRGKHIRKAQEDIISNTNLINEKASELSISELDLVNQQITSCFISPIGIKIDPTHYVKINAKIQKNRRVIRSSIKILATNIPKSNPIYGPVTESAMRTLLNPECSPLKLPEDKYTSWDDLTLTFDYSMMRGN